MFTTTVKDCNQWKLLIVLITVKSRREECEKKMEKEGRKRKEDEREGKVLRKE